MVVFVDLEEEGKDVPDRDGVGVDACCPHVGQVMPNSRNQPTDEPAEERENPNINGFSAALSCYP